MKRFILLVAALSVLAMSIGCQSGGSDDDMKKAQESKAAKDNK